MSSKINICGVLKGHFKTLKDVGSDKISRWDMFTFIFLPLIVAIVFPLLGDGITKDLISLLVNFSAILTALLLSVLVLVYDQETKIRQNKTTDTFYTSKKKLLTELYYNICYSIICGVFLVVLCFITSLFPLNDSGYFFSASHIFTLESLNIVINYTTFKFILCPLIIFTCVHLILNIIMIVKRMHALLTIDE